jgi:hypothetical protein
MVEWINSISQSEAFSSVLKRMPERRKSARGDA